MRRFAPALVLLLFSAVGVLVTYSIYVNEKGTRQVRFELLVDDLTDRLGNRIQQHLALLVATSAYAKAIGKVPSRAQLRAFIEPLDLIRRYDGVQGIGLARILQPGEDVAVGSALNEEYGTTKGVWPPQEQSLRTAIVALEPMDDRNIQAIGYDMYGQLDRRLAMQRALDTGETSASAPITLVQEITVEKQAGFLVYMPLRIAEKEPVVGFVYAAFRAGDLYASVAADRELPIAIEAFDKNDAGPLKLLSSAGANMIIEHGSFTAEREFAIAGRAWLLRFAATPAFTDATRYSYTVLTGVISFFLALAMAAAARFQIQASARADALIATSESSIREKDLLLQEMKHRIKNSIARILAIARQTAAHSETISEFNASFTARLQSMANAQDMLTRSHWEGAVLSELLSQELSQVYGGILDKAEMSGPLVKLDGRQTQALALTFHELATNALKYGAGASQVGQLAVSWKFGGTARRRTVKLVWEEKLPAAPAPPTKRGFGSKLIRANIVGELGGSFDERYDEHGLTISMEFPT
jgi:two-component sensor histidine kinase